MIQHLLHLFNYNLTKNPEYFKKCWQLS